MYADERNKVSYDGWRKLNKGKYSSHNTYTISGFIVTIQNIQRAMKRWGFRILQTVQGAIEMMAEIRLYL